MKPEHAYETKASKTGRGIFLQTMGRPKWSGTDYSKLSKESYQRNAVSYRCVRMIAEAAARIQFRVRDGKQVLDTHPILELIKRPNPFDSRFEFLVSTYSYMLLSGNAYIEYVQVDDTGELFSLRPDRMKVVPGPKGYPKAYEYTVGREKVVYEVNVDKQLPILHIKDFHPNDDHYGLSAVQSAAYSIDIHNDSNRFLKSLLQNSAKPSGALVYKGTEGQESLSDEQYTQLKAQIEEQYSGPSNAGRPMLLDGGLEWQAMSMTPHELEFAEMKTQSARDIALAFGVPPQLLGIPGDNTYTNYSQAVRALYRSAVIPMVQHLCQDLSTFFDESMDSIEVEPMLDDLEALADERTELWDRINKTENLTVNEKRAAMGYPEYEDKEYGDKIFAPVNKQPLGTEQMVMEGSGDNPPTKKPTKKPKGDDNGT